MSKTEEQARQMQPLNIDVKVDDELNIVDKPNIHKLDYNEAVSLNSEWNKARTIRERIVSDLSSSKKVQQLTKEQDDLKLENGALLIQLQAEKKKVEELEKEQQIISRLLKGVDYQVVVLSPSFEGGEIEYKLEILNNE